MEYKYTKGPLEKKFVSGYYCIGIGTAGDYAKMTANSILPDTDKEYEGQKEQIEADMQLYSCAPEMFEMLKKAAQTINSLKLSMMAHPDHEEGSEFDDMTDKAERTHIEIMAVMMKATTI